MLSMHETQSKVVSKTRENDNEILILNKNGKLSQNWHKITLNKIAKYQKLASRY